MGAVYGDGSFLVFCLFIVFGAPQNIIVNQDFPGLLPAPVALQKNHSMRRADIQKQILGNAVIVIVAIQPQSVAVVAIPENIPSKHAVNTLMKL